MTNVNYIKSSSLKTQKKLKEYTLFNDIQIVIKDNFLEDLNLENVLTKIENRLPSALLKDIDIIYIGQFPQLKARNVESAFMNGAVFVSNEIQDEDTLLKSVIHELAHNVESVYGREVYGDNQIVEEFIDKRTSLRGILEQYNLFCDPRLYLQFEYNRTFDDFLYKTVGYDRLTQLTSKLFVSPYAATSLREYFANGFEHYFVDENPKYLKSISPKIYSKLVYLTKI